MENLLKFRKFFIFFALLTLFSLLSSVNSQGQEITTTTPVIESSTASVESAPDLLVILKRYSIPALNNPAELKRASCILRELFLSKEKSYKKLTQSEVEAANALISKKVDLNDGLYISLVCQYGYHIKGNEVRKFFRVSTGRPGMETKTGVFKVYYQYNGWWESTLYPGSMMYRPKYFYKNMGIHGLQSDSSVKPYPASHGCVRVVKSTMDYLWSNTDKSTLIKIYK